MEEEDFLAHVLCGSEATQKRFKELWKEQEESFREDLKNKRSGKVKSKINPEEVKKEREEEFMEAQAALYDARCDLVSFVIENENTMRKGKDAKKLEKPKNQKSPIDASVLKAKNIPMGIRDLVAKIEKIEAKNETVSRNK